MKKGTSRAEYIKIKQRAKHLVIIEGMYQKDVSKILNISERIISRWSIKDGWHNEMKVVIGNERGVKSFILKFFTYLFSKEPALATKIKNHWYDFLKKEKKDIDL